MSSTAPRAALHYGLWATQGLLAFAFLMAGAFKATSPIPELVANGMDFTADYPAALTRFAGVSELLGAIGLILPSALRIQPKLTALAAAGLVTVMVLASLMHLVRGELDVVPVNLFLGALAAFVAWGRAVGAPIAPR